MRDVVQTKLPTTVPISQAIRAGDFIFVSGQVPVDHITNQLVHGGIERQTEVVLERIKYILESAGSSLDDVIKFTAFLTNIKDFAGMNQVFQQYFRKIHQLGLLLKPNWLLMSPLKLKPLHTNLNARSF